MARFGVPRRAMMKRRVNRLLAGATAIVMMALTACSGGGQTPASQAAAGSTQAAAADSQAEAPADQKEEPAAGEPKYGGQLRVTLNNDPASMDPLLEDSEPGQIPAAHILETAL